MPDIHHSINIGASPAVVHQLVSTSKGCQQWWAEDVEPLDGGVASLGFFNGDTVYRLRPLDISALRVAWRCETGKEWEGTDLMRVPHRISFRAIPRGEG